MLPLYVLSSLLHFWTSTDSPSLLQSATRPTVTLRTPPRPPASPRLATPTAVEPRATSALRLTTVSARRGVWPGSAASVSSCLRSAQNMSFLAGGALCLLSPQELKADPIHLQHAPSVPLSRPQAPASPSAETKPSPPKGSSVSFSLSLLHSLSFRTDIYPPLLTRYVSTTLYLVSFTSLTVAADLALSLIHI